MELVKADVVRAGASASARVAAVRSLSAFTADLFGALPASGNLVCSPYSVAVALGMTVQGARGATAAEMLSVLHADAGRSAADTGQDGAAARLAAGLNAVDQALAERSAPVPDPSGGPPAELVLAGANSLWGQRGTLWQQPFLDRLARDFGAGLRAVDFAETEPARRAINGWVSGQTRERIPELLPAGVLDPTTRLVLVNALYLKAPWRTPFETRATRPAPFHRLDGSTVTAQAMTGDLTADRFGRGAGWVAADLPYAGGELAMTVVVPDAGRFAEVRKSLAGTRLATVLEELRPSKVEVTLPRWTTRSAVALKPVLTALGISLAFDPDQADFTGMTAAEKLYVSAAVHAGFIAVNEAGTEAAAATAVVMAESAAMQLPTVVADRPFLYLVRDRPTGALLFAGQVLDPTR